MIAKFSVVNSERTESKLRKTNFGVVLSYIVKRVRELSHATRLRNVQKSVMHVHSWCFANINLLLFSSSLWRRQHCCLSSL